MATEYKLSYTGSEINAKLSKIDSLAEKSKIPTNISQLNNDSGFITSYTESDPTVPDWAKAEKKPTYTASEVGALPDSTKIPSKVSDLDNDKDYITAAEVPDEIYVGDGTMPKTATIQFIMDASDEEALLKNELQEYINTEIEAAKTKLELDIPEKTSQLTNDSGFITAKDVPQAQVPDLSGYALKSSAETWTFTLSDGSKVTKKVVLA